MAKKDRTSNRRIRGLRSALTFQLFSAETVPTEAGITGAPILFRRKKALIFFKPKMLWSY